MPTTTDSPRDWFDLTLFTVLWLALLAGATGMGMAVVAPIELGVETRSYANGGSIHLADGPHQHWYAIGITLGVLWLCGLGAYFRHCFGEDHPFITAAALTHIPIGAGISATVLHHLGHGDERAAASASLATGGLVLALILWLATRAKWNAQERRRQTRTAANSGPAARGRR
ncbi:hypothetical protein GCM10010387_48840 [Streptomyces inusitatus]|uniref:Uncharacterized protein n=1 Tax=Streptomyces inusitatus TaxID=68221 RepID=A0A918QJ07_9ACTN|nr:hypothetical protein [Streptomyces inusitatus]GGZ48710.1 hypothetical protein GCM10010387_48840 [Streptomyces inusitatus]